MTSIFTPELNELLSAKPYTSAQVTDFAKKYKRATSSLKKEYYKQKVIEGTVRLAFKHSSPTIRKDTENFEDHFQFAILGILEALERFDRNSKFKFSTYAMFWMRYYTNIFFHEGTAVKHPRDSYIGARKYEKIINESLSTDKSIETVLRKNRVTRNTFNQWENSFKTKSSSGEMVRLDKMIPINGGSIVSIKDLLPNVGVLQDVIAENKEIQEIIKEQAKIGFTEQERAVLGFRFYPEDGEQKDYTWIGKKLNIKPKAVRIIETRIINKIKIILKRKSVMNNQNKRNLATTAGQQKIELPTDPTAKLRLMSWHGVSNDYDLKLAIYRELLKKQRYQKHTNRGIL